MTSKRIVLFGAILLLAGITALQVFVNWGGVLFGPRQDQGRMKFRVGFLPVT
jgi:hypothetical protein